MDTTTGSRSLDRRIAALAIPAMAGLLTDPLYDLCDTAILGHLGTRQLAGAALASRVLALGYATFIFLMFGTTAAVARFSGAGRPRDAIEEGVGAAWLGVGLGVAAAGVIGLAGPTLIDWFGGTAGVAADAWTYLSVSLVGFPAFMVVMAGTGDLRGTANTRLPLVIAVISVGANLIGELVAIVGLGLGVGASAATTVLAKWGSAITYLVILNRRARRLGARTQPHAATMRRLLVVGRDLVVRTAALLLTLSIATALAARQGAVALAAHSIAFGIWQFAAYISDGTEVAGQALVAHALGAGRPHDAAVAARRLLVWAVGVGLTLTIIIVACRTVLPRVFSDDPEVVSATQGILWWVAALQPINACAFALDGVWVGAGRQRFLALAMGGAALVFVATVTGARTVGAGLWPIWAGLGAFMVARLLPALGQLTTRLPLGESPG